MNTNYFDIIIPVAESHVSLAQKSLNSLSFIQNYHNIYVIGPSSIKKHFSHYSISFIDENSIHDPLNLRYISNYFSENGLHQHSAKWYFQQFLKMAFAKHELCSDYYLIVDADTIFLKPIEFFNKDNKMNLTIKHNFHDPYFDTLKYLDLPYQKDINFIAEHMIIKKSIMLEIIQHLQNVNNANSWYKNVLTAVKNNKDSVNSFSEFETYGNYIYLKYPHLINTIKRKHFRSTAIYFGHNPSLFDLFLLSLKYDYVSFEGSQKSNLLCLILLKSIALTVSFLLLKKFYSYRKILLNKITLYEVT